MCWCGNRSEVSNNNLEVEAICRLAGLSFSALILEIDRINNHIRVPRFVLPGEPNLTYPVEFVGLTRADGPRSVRSTVERRYGLSWSPGRSR
jgi:hypothetical protein